MSAAGCRSPAVATAVASAIRCTPSTGCCLRPATTSMRGAGRLADGPPRRPRRTSHRRLAAGRRSPRALYRGHEPEAAREALELPYAWADSGDAPEPRPSPARSPAGRARSSPDTAPAARTPAPPSPTSWSSRTSSASAGVCNFANYGLRLSLHCGGVDSHDQPPARLRGRARRQPGVAELLK
jgi:hypothetical protein